MSARKPKVVVVDDESGPAEALATNLRAMGIDATWQPPSGLSAKIVASCDLVLMDLDLGSESTSSFPELEAPDGIGLATILRRQKALIEEKARPVAFALLSGKVPDLAKPFPPTDRIVLLAKQHNLEWIFPKTESGTSTRSIASLATAVRDIPVEWANGIQNFDELASAFGIAGAPDLKACWDDIELCRPPTYEMTEWTHGLSVVRWMLQRILSYPCFLWDAHHVAARLRVAYPSFLTRLHDKDSQLATLLGPAEYTGILRDFSGRRWWRHRIEQIAWDLTEGDSQNSSLLRAALVKKTGREFAPSSVDRPLVCLDENYKTLEQTISFDTAIRVQPDDWPSYADAAWMSVDRVIANKALRAIVIQEDQDRLPTAT
jgi:hypothetical protein